MKYNYLRLCVKNKYLYLSYRVICFVYQSVFVNEKYINVSPLRVQKDPTVFFLFFTFYLFLQKRESSFEG